MLLRCFLQLRAIRAISGLVLSDLVEHKVDFGSIFPEEASVAARSITCLIMSSNECSGCRY